MKEYVIIIRLDELPEVKFASAELESKMKVFENWMHDVISRNILVSTGNRLGKQGKTIRNGVITNGPYAELKEIVGGYIIIRANSIDEAAEIATGIPHDGEGSIEVRPVYSEGDQK